MIQKKLNVNFLIKNCVDQSEESIWSLLLSLSYLVIKKEEYSKNCLKKLYTIEIPNDEVIESLSGLIIEILDEQNLQVTEIVEYLLCGNNTKMEELMNHFISSEKNLKNIYYSLILGILSYVKDSFHISLYDCDENNSFFS